MTALVAARDYAEPSPKLSVWKQALCGHPSCSACVPGREWWITETPTGRIVAKCRSWAEALEAAQTRITAALTALHSAEACS